MNYEKGKRMIELNIASIVGAALTGIALLFLRTILNHLKDLNGSVKATDDKLDDHMLYATDHYVKKDDCKERRDECPARKEAVT
jgi:hypothetical protein